MSNHLVVNIAINPEAPATTEMRRVLGELARTFAPRVSTHDLMTVMMTLAGDAGEIHMTQGLQQMPVPMHEALRLHALLGQRLIQQASFLAAPPANQVPA